MTELDAAAKLLGWSQEKLAKELGVTAHTIRNWRTQRRPKRYVSLALRQLLLQQRVALEAFNTPPLDPTGH